MVTTEAASISLHDHSITGQTDAIGVKDAGEAQKIVKTCIEDLLGKVEQIINNKNNDKAPEAGIVEVRADDLAAKSDNSQDMDVTIVENEEVIMIISDSEEEMVDTLDTTLKNDKKDEKMVVDEGVNDVQFVLDQMMEQTMKNTDYVDHNNSGKIDGEQVAAKDDLTSKGKPLFSDFLKFIFIFIITGRL